MTILVTGGAGYIGSHTCVELLNSGYSVVVADNLVNSKKEVISKIEKITGKKVDFFEVDVTEYEATKKIFEAYKFDGVIHFAGLKAVGESVQKPLNYYYNNILSTINLSKLCLEFNVNNFVFSSSATVYGNNKPPFVETMELLPATSPYGETKAVCEKILIDVAKVNPNFCVSLLRYFNPIGAHKSGLIGESPNGVPNNLMPYITKVAKGILPKLNVFGDDYDTPDGSCIRDYIHVVDLAKGHLKALENVKKGVNIYNLGRGKGVSVFEIIKAFEKANNLRIPFEVTERRAGDLPAFYADATKAYNELSWKTELDIEEMCEDAWRFEKNYCSD